jgi:hypothetical protein
MGETRAEPDETAAERAEEQQPDQQIEDLEPADEQVSEVKGGPGGQPWNQ